MRSLKGINDEYEQILHLDLAANKKNERLSVLMTEM